mgnify:CR=1 FL=1
MQCGVCLCGKQHLSNDENYIHFHMRASYHVYISRNIVAFGIDQWNNQTPQIFKGRVFEDVEAFENSINI